MHCRSSNPAYNQMWASSRRDILIQICVISDPHTLHHARVPYLLKLRVRYGTRFSLGIQFKYLCPIPSKSHKRIRDTGSTFECVVGRDSQKGTPAPKRSILRSGFVFNFFTSPWRNSISSQKYSLYRPLRVFTFHGYSHPICVVAF